MDILNPLLINIDGRIYCDYNANAKTGDRSDKEFESSVVWDDEPSCYVENFHPDVAKISEEKYQLRLSINNVFFKYIIGWKGEMKKRLENETRTRIEIPRKGHDGDIIITGKTSSSVLSAKNRIELLISSKRWNEPLTHFVSIPLNAESIRDRFDEFRTCVLNDFMSDYGVEEALFQTPAKLHLTICTLVLLDDKELQRAKEVLRHVVEDVLGDGRLDIKLSSLEYMNDDPAAVDVLYGKVRCLDESDRLQAFSDQVAEAFVKEGLSENRYDRVKLHCTLMNTIFRRNKNDADSLPTRTSFDASRILVKYQDFDFGRLSIKEIHLSQKGSYGADGYYLPAEKVHLDS